MIHDGYFDWLYDLVSKDRYSERLSYRGLLCRLHEIDFTWSIPRDENRAEDGIALRSRYYSETGYLADYHGPCSVLELMIALAVHCEESIMDDPMVGNRTGQWFWQMVSNLGLGSMTDVRYDEDRVDRAIYRFLDREYDSDGRGGLFIIRNCDRDVRDMEIWHQLCYFLNTIT